MTAEKIKSSEAAARWVYTNAERIIQGEKTLPGAIGWSILSHPNWTLKEITRFKQTVLCLQTILQLDEEGLKIAFEELNRVQ